MPLVTAKLTASFKLNGSIPEGLFSTYREVLSQLLDYAWAKGYKLLFSSVSFINLN
jgi:hypothetical protein